MNELIKITEKNGTQLVDARELHAFLESKQEFANWIKNRIEKYGFTEDQDYVSFDKIIKRETGASIKIEYGLTLEMAKELSMVENNEKGSKARKYFIEVEKKSRTNVLDFTDPKTVLQLAQNWADEQNKRIEAEKRIKLLEPQARLMQQVLDTDDKIDIGQAAKILELPFGRNTLFQELRERGIFFKSKNEPKQEYIDRGYFQLKEKFIERDKHEGFVVIKVLVTQKGLEFISKLFEVVPAVKQLAVFE